MSDTPKTAEEVRAAAIARVGELIDPAFEFLLGAMKRPPARGEGDLHTSARYILQWAMELKTQKDDPTASRATVAARVLFNDADAIEYVKNAGLRAS